MYLSGSYYRVEEKSDVDYDLYNEEVAKANEEDTNTEEEYNSDTVSDYMNHGI